MEADDTSGGTLSCTGHWRCGGHCGQAASSTSKNCTPARFIINAPELRTPRIGRDHELQFYWGNEWRWRMQQAGVNIEGLKMWRAINRDTECSSYLVMVGGWGGGSREPWSITVHGAVSLRQVHSWALLPA